MIRVPAASEAEPKAAQRDSAALGRVGVGRSRNARSPRWYSGSRSSWRTRVPARRQPVHSVAVRRRPPARRRGAAGPAARLAASAAARPADPPPPPSPKNSRHALSLRPFRQDRPGPGPALPLVCLRRTPHRPAGPPPFNAPRPAPPPSARPTPLPGTALFGNRPHQVGLRTAPSCHSMVRERVHGKAVEVKSRSRRPPVQAPGQLNLSQRRSRRPCGLYHAGTTLPAAHQYPVQDRGQDLLFSFQRRAPRRSRPTRSSTTAASPDPRVSLADPLP